MSTKLGFIMLDCQLDATSDPCSTLCVGFESESPYIGFYIEQAHEDVFGPSRTCYLDSANLQKLVDFLRENALGVR